MIQQAKQSPPKNHRQPPSKSELLAKAWIIYYRDEVMPEHPCTDVEGLISLFEHDRGALQQNDCHSFTDSGYADRKRTG